MINIVNPNVKQVRKTISKSTMIASRAFDKAPDGVTEDEFPALFPPSVGTTTVSVGSLSNVEVVVPVAVDEGGELVADEEDRDKELPECAYGDPLPNGRDESMLPNPEVALLGWTTKVGGGAAVGLLVEAPLEAGTDTGSGGMMLVFG